jgi:hypothetical protein
VREEEPPQDRFFDPEFQQAFGEAKTLIASLSRVLGTSSLGLEPDSKIHESLERANKLAKFQCPPTRIVALVGDSGAGMV